MHPAQAKTLHLRAHGNEQHIFTGFGIHFIPFYSKDTLGKQKMSSTALQCLQWDLSQQQAPHFQNQAQNQISKYFRSK